MARVAISDSTIMGSGPQTDALIAVAGAAKAWADAIQALSAITPAPSYGVYVEGDHITNKLTPPKKPARKKT